MTKIMSTNSKKRAREDDLDDTVATKAVFVSNRDADFNESTWWMVDIENYNGNQGATALVKRCMRNYGWNFEKTKTILQAYRQFLTLKKGFEDWDVNIYFLRQSGWTKCGISIFWTLETIAMI